MGAHRRPGGDTHTLVVPDGVEEMIALFHTTGMITYVDPDGAVTGYEDVFTRIEACRRHFSDAGLGAWTTGLLTRQAPPLSS